MKFIGLLLLDILFLIATFTSNSKTLKGKKFLQVLLMFITGILITYPWLIGVYYSLMMVIRG